MFYNTFANQRITKKFHIYSKIIPDMFCVYCKKYPYFPGQIIQIVCIIFHFVLIDYVYRLFILHFICKQFTYQPSCYFRLIHILRATSEKEPLLRTNKLFPQSIGVISVEFRVVPRRASGRSSYTLLKPNVSAEYCFNKC